MDPMSLRVRNSGRRRQITALAWAFLTAPLLALALTQPAESQTFQVIYNFTQHGGANPVAGLTVDRGGSLYGTTAWGGATDNGTVFELKHMGSGFVFKTLYSFARGSDGGFPLARVTIGPNGSLYGTTYVGGIGDDGTVFNVKPPAKSCANILCPWNETVLYRFTGGDDGRNPWAGVTFDQSGNLYGAAVNGGGPGYGVVYELIPSNGNWTQRTLYTFTGGDDGANPLAGVIFDGAGNLYGATQAGGLGGGFGNGVVYQLTPSGSGWTQHTLYEFQDGSDGSEPQADLIMDGAGNLYGNTPGGMNNGGTVFELATSGGGWTFNLLYDLNGSLGPQDVLVRDNAGNLYGVTEADGLYGEGSVFKLTPTDNGWTYTDLHDFTGGSDGGFPASSLVSDSNGNLYGTTYEGGGNHNCPSGGDQGCGVIYEITP